ncbi:hypothetical protein Golax_001401, partial [Gossypium laxum]|nr:hypothetical protein [Gossypium laxum]
MTRSLSGLYNGKLIRVIIMKLIRNPNRSGCSEELLSGNSQEPYNGKLERANNGTLFR